MSHSSPRFSTPVVTNELYCTYELLINGIHHLLVKKICPETLDVYLQLLGDIYSNESTNGETVRILDESNLHALPLTTMIMRVRLLLGISSYLPCTRHALIVSDLPNSPRVAEILMQITPILQHTIRYYHADEKPRAIEWLLQNN